MTNEREPGGKLTMPPASQCQQCGSVLCETPLECAQARIAALEAELAAGTRELRRYVEGNGFTWCDDESTVFNVTTALGLMGGTLAILNPKVAELETENAAMRARLGADDDDLLLSNEWLTATLGDQWRISVKNGTLDIMDERPGDDEDEEQELAAWFQMAGRFDMVCVRPEVKTRGDVRRLLAALGERERKDGEGKA